MKPNLITSIAFLCFTGMTAFASAAQSILPGQPIDNGNPDDLRACYGDSIVVELVEVNSNDPLTVRMQISSEDYSPVYPSYFGLYDWTMIGTDDKVIDLSFCLTEPIRVQHLMRHPESVGVNALPRTDSALLVREIYLEAGSPTLPESRSLDYWMSNVPTEQRSAKDALGYILSTPLTDVSSPNFIAPETVLTPLGDPLVFQSCGFGFMSGCDVRYSLNENLRILYRFDPDVVAQEDWIKLDGRVREIVLDMVSE